MPGQFGTAERAVEKALTAFRRGLGRGRSDCYARAGAWIRDHLEEASADPDCAIVLFGAPSGAVVHAAVRCGARLHDDPADISGEANRGMYREVGAVSLADFLDRAEAAVSHVSLSDYEFRELDELLLSSVRAADGALGFSLNRSLERTAAEKFLASRLATAVSEDGNSVRLAITQRGRAELLRHLATRLQAGNLPGERGTDFRIALAVGYASPGDPGLRGYDSARWKLTDGRELPRGFAIPEFTSEDCGSLIAAAGITAETSPASRRQNVSVALNALASDLESAGENAVRERLLSAAPASEPAVVAAF